MAMYRTVTWLLWLSSAAAGAFRSHTLPAFRSHTLPAFKSIVPEVQRRYHSSCALLVYSAPRGLAPEDELKLLEMKRFLALSLIQVAATEVKEFNFSTQKLNFCPHKPPLCVLLSSDEAITHKLKLVEEVSGDAGSDRQSISAAGSLAGPTWLQFLGAGARLDAYFGALNIPFNCKYLAVRQAGEAASLTEVYHARHPGRARCSQFGNWSLRGGTQLATTRLYQRRDLAGIALKVVATHEPPLSVLTEDDDGTLRLGGYLGDVWALLESRINFTTQFVRTGGGGWDGMIGMLLAGEVDAAVSDFTMTSDRLAAVAFTAPFQLTRYRVCIRTPSRDDGHWDDFLAPFAGRLWLTVLGSVAVFALLLWGLHRLGARLGNPEACAPEEYRLRDCLLYVFSAYCQQGNYFTPHSWPCRVVYLMCYVTGLTLLAAYSAALISSLAEEKVRLPFSDLGGLLRDGRYSFSCIAGSAEYSLFQESGDATLRAVYEGHLARDAGVLPASTGDMLARLCSHQHRAGLLSEHDLASVDPEQCGLVALPGHAFPASLALAVPRASPYKAVLNQHLNDLRDLGVLAALWGMYWPERSGRPQSPWTAVTLANTRSILVLLAAGAALALLAAWAERCSAPAAPGGRSSSCNQHPASAASRAREGLSAASHNSDHSRDHEPE